MMKEQVTRLNGLVGLSLGGMVAPALLYLTLASAPDVRSGWGVPMFVGVAAREMLGQAMRTGDFADKDFSAMLDYVCQQAGVKSPKDELSTLTMRVVKQAAKYMLDLGAQQRRSSLPSNSYLSTTFWKLTSTGLRRRRSAV